MPYVWDPNRAQYRDAKGKFVSTKQVQSLAQASLEETGKLVQRLGPKETRTVLREEIKREYIRQYLLGRGGENQMSQKDWGSVGGSIAEQYKYLDGFINDLDNLSDAEIANRSGMYINSAREAFEKGHLAAINQSGKFTEVLWVLGSTGEHCADCTTLAGKGWMKIEDLAQFPGDGSTECLTSCGCGLTYR